MWGVGQCDLVGEGKSLLIHAASPLFSMVLAEVRVWITEMWLAWPHLSSNSTSADDGCLLSPGIYFSSAQWPYSGGFSFPLPPAESLPHALAGLVGLTPTFEVGSRLVLAPAGLTAGLLAHNIMLECKEYVEQSS